jgi:hypothetical protein
VFCTAYKALSPERCQPNRLEELADLELLIPSCHRVLPVQMIDHELLR